MYFLAGLLTENREGGRAGDVRVWNKPLPPYHQRHLQKKRGAVGSSASCGGCLAASLAPRVRAAGSGRRAGHLPTFPKHNPREILTPGGRGGGGAGTKTGGADFNPDPLRTPSARLWPRGAGDGPRDVQSIRRDACRKEMVLLAAKFLKIHKPHRQPGRRL